MNSIKSHILCIEDERPIQDMIRFVLEKEGYRVSVALNGAEAKEVLLEERPDLMLIDWMLPDTSGIKLIKSFRKDEYFAEIPIILLTAKSEEDDLIEGLGAGADDYISKPVSMKTLLARINALMRRVAKHGDVEKLSFRSITLSSSTYEVWVNDQAVSLGKKDFKVLKFLMESPNRVYSRTQLLDFVWGRNHFLEERTIDVNILRLRNALKPFGADKMIQTVRGAGYRLS